MRLALILNVRALRDDPDLMSKVTEGDPNPIEYLQDNLETFISKMDVVGQELDRMIEQFCASCILWRSSANHFSA
jgi:hypothetical protein